MVCTLVWRGSLCQKPYLRGSNKELSRKTYVSVLPYHLFINITCFVFALVLVLPPILLHVPVITHCHITDQPQHEAKEIKFFDQAGRVFLHPTSILFSESNFKPGYLTYFTKTETSKVFLRDATEVPLFGLLLFGGPITINHWAGGIMVGKAGEVKLKAGTRIGVLCSQLRSVLVPHGLIYLT